MATWRMAFREGSQGRSLWPICLDSGVASIQYDPLQEIDLSLHSPGEPRVLWKQLTPTQHASLRRLAYEMRQEDTIYVREGKRIVCRGAVCGSYRFNPQTRVIDSRGVPWPHEIPVAWEVDFPGVQVSLGTDQLAVRQITPDQVSNFDAAVEDSRFENLDIEAREGEVFKAEAVFRSRNRSLIEAKKAMSKYRCEVCGFSFEYVYGTVGSRYIIAHHKTPLAGGPTTTSLDDLSLVCANCHAMLHTQNPPMSVEVLRHALANADHRADAQ
jgi:hypothetical protein